MSAAKRDNRAILIVSFCFITLLLIIITDKKLRRSDSLLMLSSAKNVQYASCNLPGNCSGVTNVFYAQMFALPLIFHCKLPVFSHIMANFFFMLSLSFRQCYNLPTVCIISYPTSKREYNLCIIHARDHSLKKGQTIH